MLRLLIKICVGILAFVIGIGVSSIWYRTTTDSLCEVRTKHADLANKEVRFRALLDLTAIPVNEKWDQVMFDAWSLCSSSDDCSASIEFASDIKASGLTPYYRKWMRGPDAIAEAEQRPVQLADVIISGQLDSFLGQGCFGPEMHVSKARIERIISKHDFVNGQQAVDWLRLNYR